MALHISENFGDLLDPRFRKIFVDTFQQLPSMREFFYTIVTSTKDTERDSSIGAFGDFEPFNGTVGYDEITQGYSVIYTHVEFAKGFKVERKLFDDDQFNVMDKRPAGLALAAKRTREKYSAHPFNNAFTGSGTITIGGTQILNNSEGQSLCASAHPSRAVSTTQSNAGSTALSATAVEATRILMSRYLDDNDNKIAIQPSLLLVPRNLEETGYEIIASKGKVNSADNNANFHYGKYNLAVWDYLTDSNNWFMIDESLMKMYLQWVSRVPLQFFMDKSSDTFISKWTGYERYSFGFSDWRWVYGHNVV